MENITLCLYIQGYIRVYIIGQTSGERHSTSCLAVVALEGNFEVSVSPNTLTVNL
jgi:hypothetical protein